jgi:bifunctional isochorismate lyase / aryl carrier protein
MQRRLGRDCVIVVGVFTSIGRNSSARDAFMRDIRVFVVADAVAGIFSPQDHNAALAKMRRLLACVIDADLAPWV